MSHVQHIPLSPEQKKQLRVSLCGAGITVIAGASWAVFIAMHFQDVYGPWLPRIGGTAYGIIWVSLVGLGLGLGVVGQMVQRAGRGIKEITLSFLMCFAAGSLVFLALFLFEAIGRGVFGGSFYPQMRTVFVYGLLEQDRDMLIKSAPQSKEITRIQAVLDKPEYASIHALRTETAQWLSGEEAARALSLAMLFPEIRASKEYQRAVAEGFVAASDLEVWKKIAISLPPEAASQSHLHQEAWLRLAGHERIRIPIRGEE